MKKKEKLKNVNSIGLVKRPINLSANTTGTNAQAINANTRHFNPNGSFSGPLNSYNCNWLGNDVFSGCNYFHCYDPWTGHNIDLALCGGNWSVMNQW